MMFRIRFNLLGGGLVGIFLLQNAEKRLSAGFLLITAAGSHRQQKRHLPGTHGRVFAGQVSCVRRESAAVNGQEQNGLIAQTL